MAAYLIVRVTITDPERYGEYLKHGPRIVESFGGRYIVRGGEMTTVEGPEETDRIVVIEYPNMQAALDLSLIHI